MRAPRVLPSILAAACLVAGLSETAVATAQVKRCTTVDGHTLYTDRRCEDLGATERLPRGDAGYANRLPYRGGCTRQLQDLIFEVTSAIDAGDTNRLAGVYHWPGLSSRSGYAVVGRLDSIANRPLVDIRALRPALPAAEPGAAGVAIGATDGDYYPQTTVRRAPTALRIEQTLSDGVTPSRTTFGLRKHMGCWWITL
jgi:hypothetical protein